MSKPPFAFDGTLPDGSCARLYELTGDGLRAYISDFGATIVALMLQEKDGSWTDVALGYEKAAEYLRNPGDMGGTIGRYAGRIGGGTFPLGGRTVTLSQNRPEGTIHGGLVGFHKQLWRVEEQTASALNLFLHSPDGDQGFPGALDVWARFSVEGKTLRLTTEVFSHADTVCSLTNHAYWNLTGEGTIDDHRVCLASTEVLDVDAQKVPTGLVLPTDGCSADLRTADAFRGRRCDHTCPLTFDGTLRLAGRVSTAERAMELWTDLPAVQVYTADGMAPLTGKYGQMYGPRRGFCLEPQYYPDSPNHPRFPSTFLAAGERRVHRMEWRFSLN